MQAGGRPQADTDLLRRQLRSGKDISLLQSFDGKEGFYFGILCGDSHRGEISADGGKQYDSPGWSLHRRSNPVRSFAPMGRGRARASYFDETREQMEGLWGTLGYKKIGVIYPEDPFGAAVLEGVKTALKTHGAEPVATASYPRQTAQVGG